MKYVGRKLYFTTPDNAVVGLAKLNRNWEAFRHKKNSVFIQTTEMANLVGCIFPFHPGTFTEYTGEAAGLKLEQLKGWLTQNSASELKLDWLIGRRMISSWDSQTMILIENLRMSPPAFQAEYGAGRREVLVNLFEFDGVFIERDAEEPAMLSTGTLLDTFSDPYCWITSSERSSVKGLIA